MTRITLTPAYGRDYKSKKALLQDIKDNKDFIINAFGHPSDTKPCSPSDFKGQTIMFRYDQLRKITPVEL